MSEYCPICRKPTEDMRHVSVECFYQVNEVAPRMREGTILREVEMEKAYWGVTRTYKEGTRDTFEPIPDERPNVVNVKTVQVPVEPIRVLETKNYTMECCKICRGEFLEMLKKWTNGEFINKEWRSRE